MGPNSLHDTHTALSIYSITVSRRVIGPLPVQLRNGEYYQNTFLLFPYFCSDSTDGTLKMGRTGQCKVVPKIMMIFAGMFSLWWISVKKIMVDFISFFCYQHLALFFPEKRPKFTCVSQNVSILDFFSRTGIEVGNP